jgi:hypothetical protein
MPWSYSCGACRSRDIQVGANEITCLKCGRLTDANGVPVPLLAQAHSEDHYNALVLADLQQQVADLQAQVQSQGSK